jgi:DNA-binding NarL/FixJ family response regulator
MYMRSVVVVEDDDMVRSLIASHIESAGFQVAVASNFTDAMRLIKVVDPDAVVLDIDLGPGPNGFDIAERLWKKSDETAVVFLTTLSDPRLKNTSLKKSQPGVAYLNKHMVTDAALLVEALKAALTDTVDQTFRHDLSAERPLAQLSNLQLQILKLIAEGKTNQQISDIRGRSLAATESAISRTLKALDLDSSSELNTRVLAAREYMKNVAVSSIETNE